MRYQLVVRSDVQEMANAVAEQIAAGWTLQGGISVAAWAGRQYGLDYVESIIYAQAMVQLP